VTVTLEATNAGGMGSDTFDVTVNAAVVAPSITITCTTPITEGGSTNCSVFSNTGDAIDTYAWSDNGGGGGGAGISYSPTLSTAGPVTVTLVATNAGGSSAPAQFLVTVDPL